MVIHEARWLTCRMTFVLMAAVLLLCYCVDNLKCKKQRSSFCIGEPVFVCEEPLCHDFVLGVNPVLRGADCASRPRTSATLLYHIIEVASSLSVDQTSTTEQQTLGQEMATALESAIQTNATLPAWLKGHLDSLQALNRTSSTIEVSADRIVFDYPDRTEKWIDELQTKLPTSERTSSRAMWTHFPVLFKQLSGVVKQRKFWGRGNGVSCPTDNTGCHTLQLVVITVVNPGVIANNWAESSRPPSSAVQQLQQGHYHLRDVISTYLSNKKGFTMYLNSVHYVSVPLIFPAHVFQEMPQSNSTQTLESALPCDDNYSGEKLCPAATQWCLSSCSILHDQASRGRSIAIELLRSWQAQPPYKHTTMAPHQNCYYHMQKALAAPKGENHSESYIFADCLRLTAAGLEAFAQCLVTGQE